MHIFHYSRPSYLQRAIFLVGTDKVPQEESVFNNLVVAQLQQ